MGSFAPYIGPGVTRDSLDIVDAQIHLSPHMHLGEVLAAMDVLGIQGAVIDEFWGMNDQMQALPCAVLPGGGYRPLSPLAQAAALLHPQRFSYFQRVDRHDPELAAVFAMLGAAPGARAVRLEVREPAERKAMAEGGYAGLLELAQEYALPVCVHGRDTGAMLRAAVARHPQVRFVLDHCGWPRSAQQWNEVLALGANRNVWLKWSHAHRAFASGPYPFAGLHAELARAIDAFGIERVVWASDFTHERSGCTWSDLLHYCRDAAALSGGDREWLLGKGARTLFRWEAPALKNDSIPAHNP